MPDILKLPSKLPPKCRRPRDVPPERLVLLPHRALCALWSHNGAFNAVRDGRGRLGARAAGRRRCGGGAGGSALARAGARRARRARSRRATASGGRRVVGAARGALRGRARGVRRPRRAPVPRRRSRRRRRRRRAPARAVLGPRVAAALRAAGGDRAAAGRALVALCEEVAPGVWALPLFTEAAARARAELAHYEASGIPRRPNGMNRYGAILGDLGLQPLPTAAPRSSRPRARRSGPLAEPLPRRRRDGGGDCAGRTASPCGTGSARTSRSRSTPTRRT